MALALAFGAALAAAFGAAFGAAFAAAMRSPALFSGEGRSDISTINVQNPVFVKVADSLLTAAPLDEVV